jgi:phosphatidylinositol-3-phosphatase
MKKLLMAAVVTAFVMTGSVHAQGSNPVSPPSPRLEGIPPLSHVFFIIGENTSYVQVDGNTTDAPYINNTLKPQSAWLTNYSALHAGSLSDYVGLTSGQYIPCDVQDIMPNKCHQNIPNLFSQLDTQGVSWKEWTESAANPCDYYDSGTDWAFNIYGAHHNPAIYYDNIEGNQYTDSTAPSSECINQVVPTGTTQANDTSFLDAALASGNVPKFNMIIPNDCEQGHDLCGNYTSPVRQFDDFLAREIPKIKASRAWDANSVIIVTYDEWNDSPLPPKLASGQPDQRVVFLVNGTPVQPGSTSSRAYTHYSFLRTIEDAYGISTYLGGAAAAMPINDVWHP